MTAAIPSTTAATPTATSAATSAAPSAATPAGKTEREKLAGVAKQFEAIFLRQMLGAARAANFGDTLFGDSQAMGTFRQMQDERFADIAADRGAFGLAKMIETHLARFVPAAKSTEAKTDGV